MHLKLSSLLNMSTLVEPSLHGDPISAFSTKDGSQMRLTQSIILKSNQDLRSGASVELNTQPIVSSSLKATEE
jgi:hypothetical protein